MRSMQPNLKVLVAISDKEKLKYIQGVSKKMSDSDFLVIAASAA